MKGTYYCALASLFLIVVPKLVKLLTRSRASRYFFYSSSVKLDYSSSKPKNLAKTFTLSTETFLYTEITKIRNLYSVIFVYPYCFK